MKVVTMPRPSNPKREEAIENLKALAQGMEEGWVDAVAFVYLKPDDDVVCGLATGTRLDGLRLAGMTSWLDHWVKNEAEFDE